MSEDDADQELACRASPAVALALVSVWFDAPGRSGFRARVSATAADGTLATLHVTADPDTVPAAVETWLTELLSTTG